jgi:hypothetical protein
MRTIFPNLNYSGALKESGIPTLSIRVLERTSHWDFLPPASQRGNKVTLIPPLVFQGDFSNLFNSE